MDEQNGDKKKGIYHAAFTLEEAAELINQAMGASLDDELLAVRVIIRRALLKLEEELEPADFDSFARLVLSGANTVAHLLKTSRALSGKSADSIAGSMAQIILELKDERGWEI